MYTKKAIQLGLLLVSVVAVTAEPPSIYGAPFAVDISQAPTRQQFAYDVYRQPMHGGYSGQYVGLSHVSRGSQRYQYQDRYENSAPQPFNFQYDVRDAQSGNDFGHRANSDGRRVQGEYQVLLPDGRRQIVTYTADDNGYNADVRYEGQARIQQEPAYGGYQRNAYSGHIGGFSGYSY